MKKIFNTFMIILLVSLLTPSVIADGFFHVYDRDMWKLFNEEQQICAINYKDGIQNMILTIDTGEELKGEKAVWIFPVPAKPDNVAINILQGFPMLLGYDVEEKVDETISEAFTTMRLTQIYTFPLFLFNIYKRLGVLGGADFKGSETEELSLSKDVIIHERLEKMGVSTELVSAVDAVSLSNYLTHKGLTLEDSSRLILDEYIGQEYSFVISWISDLEKFKQYKVQVGDLSPIGNSIGVFISFPTDRMYYPLKPTSVYGGKKVPAIIYIMGHVQAELYPEIISDSEVNYFLQSLFIAPEGLKDFFTGFEKKPSTFGSYWNLSKGKQEGFEIKDLKYTKVKISPPSKYLTQDLWINIFTPLKIKVIHFIEAFTLWWGLIVFVICSCLASLLSALIIFRKDSPSVPIFLLFGLFNFITLIGLSRVAYKLAIDEKFTTRKEVARQELYFGDIKWKTLFIALIAPILLFLDYMIFQGFSGLGEVVIVIFPLLFLLGIIYVFISPFIWGYYNNRGIMEFTICFTLTFLILTVLCEIFIRYILLLIS